MDPQGCVTSIAKPAAKASPPSAARSAEPGAPGGATTRLDGHALLKIGVLDEATNPAPNLVVDVAEAGATGHEYLRACATRG